MRRAFSLILATFIVVQQCAVSVVTADLVEADLGRKFSLILQSELPLIRDYTVRRYIENLGQRIVSKLDHAEFPYQFAVAQESHVNAFSVPGGYIYLHSGLILRAKSEDEVAGVLGHEIAHIQGHHIIRQQQDTKLLSYSSLAAMALALINPVLALGAASLTATSQLKYQRGLEEEADYRGVQYMRQAGFDPHGMLNFMKTMWQEERLNAVDIPPYFRSHPISKERLGYLERLIGGALYTNRSVPSANFELEQVQAILRALTEPRSRVTADYQRRIAENPGDPRSLALLGLAVAHYNDWEQAKQLLEQASAKGVRLDRELALVYLRLGQMDRARMLLARQIEIDPDDADAHYQLCKILQQAGEATQAENECRRTVQLDPRYGEAYLTLAQFVERKGNRQEARLLTAKAMEMQGRLEAALTQYRQVMETLGPDHPQTQVLTPRMEELEEIVRELKIQRALGRRQ